MLDREMNQTQKRLHIIKLAISMTDLETIQLQILKLTPMKSDSKVQEILTLLQNESFAQAQARITDYIETAPEEIHQRISENKAVDISPEDQAIIDEFQLFVTPTEDGTKEIQEIDINQFPSTRPKITKHKKSVDYDALLSLDADDVLKGNIKIDVSDKKKNKVTLDKDTFFDKIEEEETPLILDDYVPKDTFFDKEETEDEKAALLAIEEDQVLKGTTKINSVKRKREEEKLDTILAKTPEPMTEKEKKTTSTEVVKTTKNDEKEKDTIPAIKESTTQNFKEKVVKQINKTEVTKNEAPLVENNHTPSLSYEAIPDISQKLISMKKLYPPIQKSYEKFDTVEALMKKIAQEGYSETEMNEMQEYIQKRIADEKYTEAAQLLLLCGATESKFSQFMLARELFKGSVLTKNIDEAFTLMNILANDDYPEALCDLGQLYEHGIGTTSDLMKAEGLYKEAVDLGIKRAKKHYTRLKKINRSIFKG